MRSLLVLAAVLSLGACVSDYSCTEFCEDQAECEGASATDCSQDCEEISSFNDDAGCDHLFDLMLSCAGDQEDVCAESSSCTEEAGAWAGCVLAYCETHTTDERCAGFSG